MSPITLSSRRRSNKALLSLRQNLRTQMASRALRANDNIFFVPLEDALVAWDFVRHRQFLLSAESVRAIVDLNFRATCPHIVGALTKAEILVEAPSGPKPQWAWDILSKIFHFGTCQSKPSKFAPDAERRAREYVEYCTLITDQMPADCFRTVRGTQAFSISEIDAPALKPLIGLLEKRRSNRTFSAEEITLSQVSVVLDETFRYRDHDQKAYRRMGMVTPTARRSSPSGGSLQSCEAYLLGRKVAGIQAGIYHFRSHLRSLGLISALPNDFSFGALCGGQMFADDLSAAIVITCRFDKLMWKYRHSHAYRVALFDAGHLSQTAQLLATAVGLRTWVTAAFFDEEVRRILQINPESTEYPLLVVGLGTGPVNPFDVYLGEGFTADAG
jgi:SagB-type dehydrogenase family enzyme